jgi:hypothetical protein
VTADPFRHGVLDLIAANGVILAIHVGLATIFVLAVLARLRPHDLRCAAFARAAPMSLVSIGLLGAVVGIFMGLHQLGGSALERSTPPLVESLKAACFTAILGAVLAGVFRIYEAAMRSLQADRALGALGAERAAARHGAEASEADLHGALAGKVERTLVPQLEKLVSLLADQLEGMRRELNEGFEELRAISVAGLPSAARGSGAPAETAHAKEPAEDNLPARRFRLKIPITYTADGRSGRATIVNISSTGALVRQATVKPKPGALIKMSYSCDGERNQTTLLGEVVRHAGTGFAVQFDDSDAR